MKYIRTSTNIFEVVGENDKVYYVKAKGNPHNVYSKSKCQTDIIKESKTIEELCDECVIVDNRPPKMKRIADNFERAFAFKKHCTIKEKEITIYGAIWTDKGLIYVAKMNDKGDLELL